MTRLADGEGSALQKPSLLYTVEQGYYIQMNKNQGGSGEKVTADISVYCQLSRLGQMRFLPLSLI